MAKRKNRYKKSGGCKDNIYEKMEQSARNEKHISQEQMIEIHAEAYYRALKRIEKEKTGTEERRHEKKKYTLFENILFISNVIIFPWRICKKYTINNKIHDSILVLFVSLIFSILGFVMWLSGLIGMVTVIFELFAKSFNGELITAFTMALFMSLFGSIFILAGKEFEKETDSAKIYAYFSCIIAFISCVVAVVAIAKNAS